MYITVIGAVVTILLYKQYEQQNNLDKSNIDNLVWPIRKFFETLIEWVESGPLFCIPLLFKAFSKLIFLLLLIPFFS